MKRHWTLLRILRRGWEVFRTEGLKSLWFKVLGEVCYRRVILLERSLEHLRRPEGCELDIRIETLAEPNMDDYRSLVVHVEPDEIRRRLQAGMFCGLGRHQGEVVYSNWLASGTARIDYLDLEIGLAPGVLYSCEGHVSPAFRRKGIGAEVSWAGGQYLNEMGYNRIVVVVMPELAGAMRFHLKNGYRIVGRIQSFRLGRWRHNRLVAREQPAPVSLP